MDFYEVGVYLVIVIVASTSVFGVMWLLIRSMTPKRRKSRRPAGLLKAGADARPAKPANNAKKNGKGKSKGKKDDLPELKEYPESKMLPMSNEKGKKSKAEDDKHSRQKQADETKENEKVLAATGGAAGIAAAADAAVAAGAAAAARDAANQESTAQEGGEITLPDLPSMDTLTEGEEELPKEEVDLMSVFQTEDAEDSSTSDLAANLFDVDVANIEKLGSEVSQFLSGMR